MAACGAYWYALRPNLNWRRMLINIMLDSDQGYLTLPVKTMSLRATIYPKAQL